MRSTLPPHGPGTVRVFAVKGRYLPEPGPAKMRAATSVSIVDITPRMIQVSIEMQPPPGAIACHIRVSFRCRVIEPATVAQLHLHDLQSALDAYLAQSSRLRRIAAPVGPNQLHQTYLMIQQRISAQFSVQPPEIPGMRIELGSIQVDVS